MASDTSITEASTVKAGLLTSHSQAAFTHLDPQSLCFGKLTVPGPKGVNMAFHI